MVLGRMVWNFTREAKVFRITAWNFTLIFVVLDIMYVDHHSERGLIGSLILAVPSRSRCTEQLRHKTMTYLALRS